MTSKNTYVERNQARLDKWDAENQEFVAKAIETKADMEANYEEQIALLQDAQKNAQSKLDNLRSADDDLWTELKTGVESAWERLESATKSAVTRFNR